MALKHELFLEFSVAATKAKEALEASTNVEDSKASLLRYSRVVEDIVMTELTDKFHAAVKEETRRIVLKVFDEFIDNHNS